MDFTTSYSLPSPHGFHPGAFMPLTPSQPASSGGMNNRSPPQDVFDERIPHADRYHSFDFNPGFPTHQHAFFPGPPTPPNNNHNNNGLRHGLQGQSPPASEGNGSNGSLHGDFMNMHKNEGLNELVNGQGGSEEDDSVTPAQSRRKAQNRAAQRAFRERKEKHIKDLETKLASLEAAQREAANENERLRRDLHKISTENQILRATSTATLEHAKKTNQAAALLQQEQEAKQVTTTTGPMIYKPTDFTSTLLNGHIEKGSSHRIITSDDGQRLFAAGATWDYVVSHESFKKGLLDVSKVSDNIKNFARCDGQGPVFSERDIQRAIEQSTANGSDDLL